MCHKTCNTHCKEAKRPPFSEQRKQRAMELGVGMSQPAVDDLPVTASQSEEELSQVPPREGRYARLTQGDAVVMKQTRAVQSGCKRPDMVLQ